MSIYLFATCLDFNLMDVFQMIDVNGKGWVSGAELAEAITDLGVFVNRDDVYLFVRRYDKDSDGRLLYSDFCDAFTPRTGSHGQVLNSRKAYYLHQP